MPNEPLAFVTFTGDLVTFALKKILKVDWKFPFQKTPHRKTFKVTVGEAALVFRDRHSDEFAERIAAFPSVITADVETAIDFLEHFVGTHFKGLVPLMELIVYCAFLVDLCLCCAENGGMDLLDDIVSESYDVYADRVQPYFYIVGGWWALERMAKVYLDYVESMRKYSVLVATGSKEDVAIPSDNKYTHGILIKQFRDIKVKDVNSIAYKGSESQGATSTAAASNIVSLETKDSQTIPKDISRDSDYNWEINVETSSIDSEDLMSISSTETDDAGICRSSAIARVGSIGINETNTRSSITQYRQEFFSGTTSSCSDGSGSICICCLANKCKCGDSSASTGSFRTYSNETPNTISNAASNNTRENIDDGHVGSETNRERDQ